MIPLRQKLALSGIIPRVLAISIVGKDRADPGPSQVETLTASVRDLQSRLTDERPC